MKIFRRGILLMALAGCSYAFAGNEDRAGEAGASELLINPWGRTSGWGSANSAGVTGIESFSLNIAGLAYTESSELVFTNTNWMSGADVSINALGFAHRLGESGGVLGVSAMAMSFGDIDITTVDNPDGGLGTFSPNYFNIGIAYAKNFSNTISGGLVVKLVSEGTSDVSASGIAIDAGVNYVTGDMRQMKFGITLRNVGPTMEFAGNGLSDRLDVPNSDKTLSVNQRSKDFELPSMVNIGLSYDFFLTDAQEMENEEWMADHRITAAGTFTSNSFTKDQFRVGVEYAFREMFMVRGGYVYESDVSDDVSNATANLGPSFGATIQVPLGESGSTFGIDYSYRVTRVFDGSHGIGVKMTF